MNKWRVFAPAEDWRRPIEVDESQLPLLAEVAERFSMRMTRDDVQQKLYLALQAPPAASSARSGEGVTYPSGLTIPKAVLSEAEAARYGTTGIYMAAPLLAAKRTDRLSEHFMAGEFFCHDSSYQFVRVSPELVRRLEKVREGLGGVAVTVLSAYRPPAYNALQEGSATHSAHIDGLAADIFAEGVSTQELHRVCENVIGVDGGVGYYPSSGFCHIDVRGSQARWSG